MPPELEEHMTSTINSQKLPGKPGLIGPPADVEHLYSIIEWYRNTQHKRFSSLHTLLKLTEWLPPFKTVDFPGIRSVTGTTVDGIMIFCPIMVEMVAAMRDEGSFKEHSQRRVLEACMLASKEGGSIVALGAFTSIAVVGAEDAISDRAGIAVTSGNTLTAWLTVQGIANAAQDMDLDLAEARVAVIGASGDIGRGVCAYLADKVAEVTLTARRLPQLQEFAAQLRPQARGKVNTTGDNHAAARDADIIVTTAISSAPIIGTKDVKAGAIVCDVGYPKNISAQLEEREDVLAFSGGLAKTPFTLDFGWDPKLPANDVLYGCFSEAIVLSMEGIASNYSKGRGDISMEKMQEIGRAAKRHGFVPALYYAGRSKLKPERVDSAREFRRAALRGKPASGSRSLQFKGGPSD